MSTTLNKKNQLILMLMKVNKHSGSEVELLDFLCSFQLVELPLSLLI